MSLLVALALSLGLTLLFELPVAYLWGLRGRDLGTAALAQMLTNPAVVLLHALALSAALPGAAVTAALEGGAVLAEWRVYARCTEAKRPLALSLCANVFSCSLGLLLGRLL